MGALLFIDGAAGEGGGQILRTSLALSLVTGTPFHIEGIRAGRAKPGLMRQHLTAVEAAATVGGATVTGAEVGSTRLQFRPARVAGGRYRFSVGTAGSATLVLQTVLPALLSVREGSELILEGGTHNPAAPPFDFLDWAFLPLLQRMGADVEAKLERPGFYPAGGGRFGARIGAPARLRPLALPERGAVVSRRAVAVCANLPPSIGRREIEVVRSALGLEADECEVRTVQSPGPGNVVLIEIASEHITEVFAAFGERKVPAEAVAAAAAREAAEYLEAGVPVGPHLADQLLLPLALAGGGAFRSVTPTQHTRTQAEVLRRFLGIEARIEPEADDRPAPDLDRGSSSPGTPPGTPGAGRPRSWRLTVGGADPAAWTGAR